MADLGSYFLPDHLDPHTWDREPSKPCKFFVNERACEIPHGMVCSTCGLRRYGPFRSRSNDHFFTHKHPDGKAHELLPPCNVQVLKPEISIQDVNVCAVCQQIIMNTSHGCRYGHEEHKDAPRVLRAYILLCVPKQEAVPCPHL